MNNTCLQLLSKGGTLDLLCNEEAIIQGDDFTAVVSIKNGLKDVPVSIQNDPGRIRIEINEEDLWHEKDFNFKAVIRSSPRHAEDGVIWIMMTYNRTKEQAEVRVFQGRCPKPMRGWSIIALVKLEDISDLSDDGDQFDVFINTDEYEYGPYVVTANTLVKELKEELMGEEEFEDEWPSLKCQYRNKAVRMQDSKRLSYYGLVGQHLCGSLPFIDAH